MGRCGRRRVRTTVVDPAAAAAPDLVERNFLVPVRIPFGMVIFLYPHVGGVVVPGDGDRCVHQNGTRPRRVKESSYWYHTYKQRVQLAGSRPPGETNTFVDSSTDNLHFVIQTPFNPAIRRSNRHSTETTGRSGY